MPQNDKTKRKAKQAATTSKAPAGAICLRRTNNIKFKANGWGRVSGGGVPLEDPRTKD